MTNSNGSNGDTPQPVEPDRMDTLESFVEALDLSIENLEVRTDAVEDEVARLSEKVTELEQQVKDIYGDEDDWEKMSHT
jgi:chaperonin cofactor prefoldin